MVALSSISPIQAKSNIDPGAFDFKGTFRDFYQELTNLLKQYGDPDQDMIVNGTYISAEQKYSAYGVMVFDTYINQLEQRQETLFNTWSVLYTLEKTLGTGS